MNRLYPLKVAIGHLTGLAPPSRGHDGKTEYKSQGAAEAAIRALVRRGERESGGAVRPVDKLHAYPCDVGGGVEHWHIGNGR